MAERLCANEPCHCEPDPDSTFCSLDCERAERLSVAGRPLDVCPCGHPECHPDNVSPDQPDPIAQPTR
jgi:hypothetical protein